jgi:hypothetical protein
MRRHKKAGLLRFARNDAVKALIQISNSEHDFAISRQISPELCVG